MILNEHKKHTALTRPAMGAFGRNEWGVLGAPCSEIKALAQDIIRALSPLFRIAYVDARHSDDGTGLPAFLANGAAAAYTDCLNHRQISFNGAMEPFQNRMFLNEADLILINSNHHAAQKQVVVIDSRKKTSLQKRLAQLTGVRLFLLAEGENDIFDFVKSAVPYWQQVPVLRLNETAGIVSFIKNEILLAKPPLNGLVLAGGRSERMGVDKGSINWHGKPQRYYMADLLQTYCDQVYVSCRDGQQPEIDAAYASLPDTFTGLGPYGAILSALRYQPGSAWLVVACDLPLLDGPALAELVANRNSSAVATAFKSPHDDLPEPLIAIWEPKSYPVLLSFLAQGYSCPRKVLINSLHHIISPSRPQTLTNVNTPDELEQIQQLLAQKTKA